jgi:regulator of sirC expression with transglutaminase-like and TPR domain
MNPVEEFAEMVSRPDERIELASAALSIAAADHSGIEPETYLSRIDEFAYGVDDLPTLRSRLFDELGFTGETEDYYAPEGSFLDVVIDRRRGIPITLSVLTIEVGRRAGIKLEGIGMPGHFLVRFPVTGQYIDPFFKGEILDERGCEERFKQVTGVTANVSFGPAMRPVSSKQEILARMLNNLKAIYRARNDGRSLEWVARMRLALPVVPREEVADLGAALALQGRFREGAAEIDAVAKQHPTLAPTLGPAARALRASLN